MGKIAERRKTRSETSGQRIEALEAGVGRIYKRLGSRVMVQTITPFLLTCYIEGESKVLAYVPIKCSVDTIDIAIDSVESDSKDQKKEVAITLRIASLIKGTSEMDWSGLKVGHHSKPVGQVVEPPSKVTISFDKPVHAWVCLILYPDILAVKRQKVMEEANEGVQLSIL